MATRWSNGAIRSRHLRCNTAEHDDRIMPHRPAAGRWGVPSGRRCAGSASRAVAARRLSDRPAACVAASSVRPVDPVQQACRQDRAPERPQDDARDPPFIRNDLQPAPIRLRNGKDPAIGRPYRRRAGIPTATRPAGTSRSTTAFAPIRAPSPMVTAPSTRAPAPISTPAPICGASGVEATSPIVTC